MSAYLYETIDPARLLILSIKQREIIMIRKKLTYSYESVLFTNTLTEQTLLKHLTKQKIWTIDSYSMSPVTLKSIKDVSILPWNWRINWLTWLGNTMQSTGTRTRMIKKEHVQMWYSYLMTWHWSLISNICLNHRLVNWCWTLSYLEMSSTNNISRYISLTLVSSLKVGEKRIREGLILFELRDV